MIDEDDARRQAAAYLEQLNIKPNMFGNRSVRLIIADTQITWYGWVFRVAGVPSVETKAERFVTIGGPGMIVILKNNGSLHVLGTGRPPDVRLAEFEASLKESQNRELPPAT